MNQIDSGEPKYFKCLNCGAVLFAGMSLKNEHQVDCPKCGYSNELDDIRIKFYTKEDLEIL